MMISLGMFVQQRAVAGPLPRPALSPGPVPGDPWTGAGLVTADGALLVDAQGAVLVTDCPDSGCGSAVQNFAAPSQQGETSMIGVGLPFGGAPLSSSVQMPPETPETAPITAEPGLVAFWDALDVPEGPVTVWRDSAGVFDLTAVNPPVASEGVITFNGQDHGLQSAPDAQYGTTAIPGGATYVATYPLPDAEGGDPGQGFSIAGMAYDDSDGTWWVANGGKNLDGVSDSGDTGGPDDVRKQTIVHLSADFSTNLGEIDIDALWEQNESPQGCAVDNANGYLWVLDPSGQAIRCLDKVTGARIPAQDIVRGYDPGSVCLAESGDALWIMSRGKGDAVIQKITTDGAKTVLVNETIDLNDRHDHIIEHDGCLYVTAGTNGAQATIIALDPVSVTPLWKVDLPYPEGPDGLVGIEGIWVGPQGKCYVTHNGYFHYGTPESPKAPLQFPVQNCVVEYEIPAFGTAPDFDVFWLGTARPSGADLAFELGVAMDQAKTSPSLGVSLIDSNNSKRVRLHKGANNVWENATFEVDHSDISLLHFAVRGRDVTLYQNDVLVGTVSYSAAMADGLALRSVNFGGALAQGKRFTDMTLCSAGLIAGGARDRSRFAAQLLWRHGQQRLLPEGHPYAETAP